MSASTLAPSYASSAASATAMRLRRQYGARRCEASFSVNSIWASGLHAVLVNAALAGGLLMEGGGRARALTLSKQEEDVAIRGTEGITVDLLLYLFSFTSDC